MGVPLFFTLAILIQFGCREAPPPASSDTRDTLVIGEKGDIGTLISILPQTVTDSYVLEALAMAPVGGEFDCAIVRQPGLVKSWEWNADGTILSMELRDDLTWEDGVKVTAHDIAFTYELLADPVVASRFIKNVAHMEPDGRPRILDATHLEWHFTHAYDRDIQMGHASVTPMPKHVFGDADRASLRGHPRADRPLSYGPWTLASWEPNQRIVLEPNPRFTGPPERKPRLDRVVFRVIPEYATRLIELEAGHIDLMSDISVDDAERLRKEHPEIRLVRRGWRALDYIVWNSENPLLADATVRRALTMATDIQGMMDALLTSTTGESYGRRAVGSITPELCAVHNDDIVPLPHDVREATAILAQQGWRDTDGDGTLDRNGTKFELTLTTTDGNKRRSDIATLVQASMRRLGVSVAIEKVESNTFYRNLRERKFDAALAGWLSGLYVDPSTTWTCDTDGQRNEFNYSGYCNKEVDALIDRGLKTSDPREAAPIWKEVQRLVYDDQPYTFLWWTDEIVGVSDRFENTSIDVGSPYGNLYAWEVPEEKVKYR